MPKSPTAAADVPTFNRFTALAGESAAQDEAIAPKRICNGPPPRSTKSAAPTQVLSPREAAVREAILATGAPESRALVRTLEKYLASATTPEARDAVTLRMEQALAARGYDVAVLRELGIHALDSVLTRAAWTTLMAELPGWASSALTAGQLARSVFSGTWSCVATVLPSLGGALPRLRTQADFDALVQSLPESIRTGLWTLHESVAQADAQSRPNLGGGHLLSALAVAALLWQLRQQLPKPSGQLQGIGKFIADLPGHWQQLAVLNGVGGALFKPVEVSEALQLAAPKVKLTPEQKQARTLHQDAVNRGSAVVPDWNPAIDHVGLSAAAGTLQPGSAIVAPPAAVLDAAPDAATSPASRQQGGVLAWLGAGIAALGHTVRGGFQAVPQAQPGVEMTLMGPAPSNEATTLLMSTDVAAATGTAATRAFPGLHRTPLAIAAGLAVTGVGALLVGMKGYFWPDTAPATPAELAERLAAQVAALPNGHWGTGLDRVLGELEITQRGPRMRRAVPDATSTPSGSSVDAGTQVQDVPADLLDALRADPALMQQVQSMRLWSVAVARDIATQPDWEWVATLPASEQELLVSQWQLLRELAPALAQVDAATDAAMEAALQKSGWGGPWQDIEVKLPNTQVAGITVDDRLPLLQYCLTREAGDRHAFLRAGTKVSAAESEQLAAFVKSAEARGLRAAINARMEQVRPALSRALQARLVIDALKAKAQGVLGSGNAHRRGAEVVLGFLRGTGAVERATLTYTDRLPNGDEVKIELPNYLVLRSVEPGTEGQVVLYRSDLSRFQAFGDETAFRQFLDTQRAQVGAFADGEIDPTLANDIVQFARPDKRADVARLVKSWEARLAAFQSGQRGPQAWDPSKSFTLAFTRVDHPEGARQHWADTLIAHGEVLAQERLQRNQLRWSPLGIANIATEAAYAEVQDRVLQTLHTHAHAGVTGAMVGALRMAGFQGPLEAFDPDLVRLRVGGREMNLVDWATHGWQGQGLRRPAMPANLPDWSPDVGGLPNTRLEPAAWLDDDALDAMQVVAYTRDAQGTLREDAAFSDPLRDASLRRAICGALEEFAETNCLADAYIKHLKALPHSAEGPVFAKALGDQLRARTAWMIEVARQDGSLDDATYRALQAAHAQLDPQRTRPSSLQGVTINGHPIVGLWAIRSSAGRHVFLPDTAHGDRLLDERGFREWLRRPEAQGYLSQRAQIRYQKSLEKIFDHTASSRGIPFGFTQTRGPKAAAAALIDARMSDVDRMTVSQLERLGDALKIIGTIGVGAACTLATGGAGAALCAAGTLGLLAQEISEGIEQLEDGDVDGAVLTLGSGLFDLVDIAQIGAIPAAMYQLGKRALDSLPDAVAALRQLRNQLGGFSPDGRVNEAFEVSRQSLASVGLPLLKQAGPDGATVYRQGERTFIEQGGRFIEAAPGEDNVLRLRMPDAADELGPPVQYKDNAWRRQQQQPSPRRGTTTPAPLARREWMSRLPDAENLPPEKLDELEAVFGVRSRAPSRSADLRHVIQELTIDQRIERILSEPETLGMPGDEAIIMRAWADSPALGNGKGVETFIDTLGEWTRGARFGRGPVGLMVRVEDARSLPGVEALIDASDIDALAQRLSLSADSPRDALVAAVRTELVETIKLDPKQSRTTWQRWIAAQHRLPTAADNLAKHFPELTKAEAEEIVTAASNRQKREMEAWIFNEPISDVVADTLTNRAQRQQRQAVVNDGIRTLADVQQLGTHLQAALTGRSITVLGDGKDGFLLLVASTTPGIDARIGFTPRKGGAMVVSDAQGKVQASWQQALFDQLNKSEQSALGDAASLRRAVVEHMRQTPLIRACMLPRTLPGNRVRRSIDPCEPAAGVSLSQEEVAARDAVSDRLYQVHQRAEREYAGIRDLFAESEALKAEKRALQAQGQTLSAAKQARMRELASMDLMHERNFRVKNFVAYALGDLRLHGEPVPLGEFPLQGGAYSGPPVAWMSATNYVGNTPIRRVLVADEQVEKTYKGKGKQRTEVPIPPNDRFRSDYAMGADLLTTSSERARSSGVVVLTEEDLRARIGPVGPDGTPGWVRLSDLDDAALAGLPRSALPETLQKLLGDAQLLPSNVRELKPGPHRVFEVRSCSEGKVIDRWFEEMIAARPELATPLRAAVNTPVEALTGTLELASDMHPCETSCNRRMAELMKVLPKVKTRVYYHFVDNPERTEWRLGLMVKREMERTRSQWEPTGEAIDKVRAGIRTALLDKANPQRREAAEAELLRNPPHATDLPVPRLWLPERVEDEGM
mgnify:CR=1 FL=1